MNKTYILLRDLPDAKANDEYKLDEQMGIYINSTRIVGNHYSSIFVENNSEWFKLKEEVKERYYMRVMVSIGDTERQENLLPYEYYFYSKYNPTQEDFAKIRECADIIFKKDNKSKNDN